MTVTPNRPERVSSLPVDQARQAATASPGKILAGALLAALVLVIGVALIRSATSGSDDNPVVVGSVELSPTATPPPTPTSLPTPELTPVPTPDPCPDTGDLLAIIRQQEIEANWDAAYTNAKAGLAIPGLCPHQVTSLAEKAVVLGLESLWDRPAAPENPAWNQATIDDYRSLERLAQHHQIAFVYSSRQGAEAAYNASQFELAILLSTDALERREISTSDAGQLRFASSAYFNFGYHLAHHAAGEDAQRLGVRALVTAHLIDQENQLGINRAWGELTRLLGEDEEQWPQHYPPLPSPLLPGK